MFFKCDQRRCFQTSRGKFLDSAEINLPWNCFDNFDNLQFCFFLSFPLVLEMMDLPMVYRDKVFFLMRNKLGSKVQILSGIAMQVYTCWDDDSFKYHGAVSGN